MTRPLALAAGPPSPDALVAHSPNLRFSLSTRSLDHGPVLLQDNGQISLLHCPKDVMLRGDSMVFLCPSGQRTQLVALQHAVYAADLQARVAVQVAPALPAFGAGVTSLDAQRLGE